MKKWIVTLLLVVVVFTIGSCLFDSDPISSVVPQENISDETWTVCWYLCGSDLESYYGCATSDMAEMMQVSLPEEVQVVIQTGGADTWYNYGIDENAIERYLYDQNGLTLLESSPQSNMGDPDTLAEFLAFCRDNYPADHTMVLFWNHGGGSVTGVAFDENYDFDSLTLTEMYDAFGRVYDLSAARPPIDVVGFDSCLMATIDTAYTFADVAQYMVASEELEPGNGWFYTSWLQALANNTGMDGAELGTAICDAYVEGCEWEGTADEITLSVTDLSALGNLMDAYERMGDEALVAALDNPGFFSKLGRAATRSESYGGNTPDQGYTNMVDLGHLVRNSADILPDNAQAVLDALDACIVYKVNGPYRQEATGLSCYYSYNSDMDDFVGYTNEGSSDAFKYLYGYAIGGSLSDAGMAYIENLGFDEATLPEVPTLENMVEDGEDFPLWVNNDGCAVLDIGRELADALKSVYFQLAYVDAESDMLLLLGRDNDIESDWENGVFLDNFRGVWGTIDGCLVYMEILYEGDDYNTYSVPILLNGEEYSLRVVYDFDDEAFHITGARRGLDENGMADKNLRQLQPGDEITTIHYISSMSGDDAFEAYEVDTITVTKNTQFTEEWMGDGSYMMLFEMVDTRGGSLWSDVILFTIEGEDIYTEVLD